MFAFFHVNAFLLSSFNYKQQIKVNLRSVVFTAEDEKIKTKCMRNDKNNFSKNAPQQLDVLDVN